MHYDENATLTIPPEGSISMLFWGQAIPVKPIESTPVFISYPIPEPLPNSGDQLIQAGCQLDLNGYTVCSQDSPLLRFSCDILMDPDGIDYGLEPKIPLVAVCEKMTQEWETAKAAGVYLVGCAFKREIHYIFKIEDDYNLVSRIDELKDLFTPIDSPDKALIFAQMTTGLDAMYSFSFDPTLMYFNETIEGTHVTQTNSVFEMNLFNFTSCSCEPFINSQIIIQVNRAGQITWKDAVPVFMTTGWSCAD